MARHPWHPRKQRTREHVLADLSVNHVEKCALQCSFAVDRLRQDYGLDLAVFTFDKRGFREDGVLWMQLKATDHLRTSRDASAVLVRLDRKDILTWIGEAYPVILVVYDARRDAAYWISIQTHFANPDAFARLRGNTITVPIPMTNVLSEKAMRQFAREKQAILEPQGE